MSVTFLVLLSGCVGPPPVPLPPPMAAWDATPPAAMPRPELDWRHARLRVAGTDDDLRTLHFAAPAWAETAAAARVLFHDDADGRRLDLAPAVSPTIWGPARRAVGLVCGDGPGRLATAATFTVALRFRLTGPMNRGGGNPNWELDGTLFEIAPGFSLRVAGRGKSERDPHYPYVATRHDHTGRDWRPATAREVVPGDWMTLVVAWDGTRARLWQNGRELALAGDPVAPGLLPLEAAPRFGGDGWHCAPIELAAFALYDRTLTSVEAAGWHVDASVPTLATPPVPQAYEHLAQLNDPAAWQAAEGLTVGTDGGALTFTLTAPTAGRDTDVLLATPVPLPEARSLNTWFCLPAWGPDYRFAISLLARDGKGKVHALPAGRFVNTHVAPGNARLAGLWRYLDVQLPPKLELTDWVGWRVNFETGRAGFRNPQVLYFRDPGIERLDYRDARWYYVVGGFRDNFALVGFNNCGARALTELTGQFDGVYIRLDNVVDQAKHRRPARLDVQVSIFDAADRCVEAHWVRDLPARGPADFWQPLPLPLVKPGTYWVRGRSHDAATGAHFTTDWVQVILLKAPAGATAATRTEPPLLRVNPNAEWGRLDERRRPRLRFHVDLAGPAELRWQVVPYSLWVPGGAATRGVELTERRAVTGPTVVDLPYVPARSAELVLAELWRDGVCVDRAERPVGLANSVDRSPPAPVPGAIKSLADFTAGEGVWVNSQWHRLNDQPDPAAWIAAEAPKVRELSPNVGMSVDRTRCEPLPGVYDWDYLQGIFDAAAAQHCRVVLYMAQKWPTPWEPIDFVTYADGSVHLGATIWGYMVGRYNYCAGEAAAAARERFNRQLVRRFRNHPGFGACYFENEHIHHQGSPFRSADTANTARFQAWLRDRYGRLGRLNDAWGTDYRRWDAVPVPTPDPLHFPRFQPHADLAAYLDDAVVDFIRDNQFAPAREEDPVRPIIVYNPGVTTDRFYRLVADNGGMLANGGTHSLVDHNIGRDHRGWVPGLLERMEPHGMWSYNPKPPYGYDEMVFGMLAMGGGGLQYHFFLRGQPFDMPNWAATDGYDEVRRHWPAVHELRPATKRHDPVGIMGLRGAYDWLNAGWSFGLRRPTVGIYGMAHWCTRIWRDGSDLEYLRDARLVYLVGEVIAPAEVEFLRGHLARGGAIVMTLGSARYDLANPDRPGHWLLNALGLDEITRGNQVEGIPVPHDAYAVGGGRLLLLRRGPEVREWRDLANPAAAWAGIRTRLVDADDDYLQIHVLQRADTFYVVTTHRADDPNAYQGPEEWTGSIRYLGPLPATAYTVTEIWRDGEVGTFTPAQLAAGFPAGHYGNWQMKIFRLAPVR